MSKSVILIIVFFISVLAYAGEVYQQTDSRGNIIYSDTPLEENAEKLHVPAANSVSNSQTQVTPASNTSPTPVTTTTTGPVPTSEPIQPVSSTPSTIVLTETPNQQNTTFEILSPKDQETIYNQPVIPVTVQIAPKLKNTEKIELLLDGKPSGLPVAGNQLELTNVDRGSHTLSAVLIDEKNQVLKQSNTVTIFVHHTSINNILNSP